MALEQTIEVFSGNDVELSVTVTDSDSDGPLDLSGAQELIWALAKSAQATALIEKTLVDGITITSALDGRLTIQLDAADLEPLRGTYYHELRLTNSLGKKSTLMYGEATIQVNLIRD